MTAHADADDRHFGDIGRMRHLAETDLFLAGVQDLEGAAQILARTLYRDMVAHGLGPEQILAVATELIDHVTEELKNTQSASGRA